MSDQNCKATIDTIQPLFSPKTLGEYLVVPVNTINKWIQQRRLPLFDLQIGTKIKRWKHATILERIESGQLLD